MNVSLNIWSAIIVLIIGLWDLQLAFKKIKDKKQNTGDKESANNTVPKPTGAGAFLILGIVFTITGIVMLFLFR